jgi:HD superfamily phosphohydrolase
MSNTKEWNKESYDSIESTNKSGWKHSGILNVPDSDGIAIWKKIQISYEIACLLHDCGHAPFSHACEGLYNKSKVKDDLCEEFNNCVDNTQYSGTIKKKIKDSFNNDLYSGLKPNPHELVSAWLVLHNKGFRNNIIELEGEPLLIARMIIGCKYSDNDISSQFLNCIISLLNGHEIDADRIDYTMRDGWISGRHQINVDKLIATIHLNKCDTDSHLDICYKKTVLPEIEGLVDAKNHSFFWLIVTIHHSDSFKPMPFHWDISKNNFRKIGSRRLTPIRIR